MASSAAKPCSSSSNVSFQRNIPPPKSPILFTCENLAGNNRLKDLFFLFLTLCKYSAKEFSSPAIYDRRQPRQGNRADRSPGQLAGRERKILLYVVKGRYKIKRMVRTEVGEFWRDVGVVGDYEG
jgi:hypothetical protein